MSNEDAFSVGQRVRVYPDTDQEQAGRIIEDFVDTAGHPVIVGDTSIVGPSRRWAVTLDDGRLVFVDTEDLDSHDG